MQTPGDYRLVGVVQVGVMQVAAALLLLVPRTAPLAAVLVRRHVRPAPRRGRSAA